MGGVSSLSELPVSIDRPIGHRHPLEAELLFSQVAIHTLPARIDHASDSDPVSDPVPGDIGSYVGHDSGDLMPGDEGIAGAAPLSSRAVDIRMADPAVADFDEHVLRLKIPTLDRQIFEIPGRAGDTSCICCNHTNGG